MVEFDPTAVRGNWFEINDHNYPVIDAPKINESGY
jgi:hypothetical protein